MDKKAITWNGKSSQQTHSSELGLYGRRNSTGRDPEFTTANVIAASGVPPVPPVPPVPGKGPASVASGSSNFTTASEASEQISSNVELLKNEYIELIQAKGGGYRLPNKTQTEKEYLEIDCIRVVDKINIQHDKIEQAERFLSTGLITQKEVEEKVEEKKDAANTVAHESLTFARIVANLITFPSIAYSNIYTLISMGRANLELTKLAINDEASKIYSERDDLNKILTDPTYRAENEAYINVREGEITTNARKILIDATQRKKKVLRAAIESKFNKVSSKLTGLIDRVEMLMDAPVKTLTSGMVDVDMRKLELSNSVLEVIIELASTLKEEPITNIEAIKEKLSICENKLLNIDSLNAAIIAEITEIKNIFSDIEAIIAMNQSRRGGKSHKRRKSKKSKKSHKRRKSHKRKSRKRRH